MGKKKIESLYELEREYMDISPKEFLYDRQGPWPQPSANHPFGEVPGVLHIPFVEWIWWWMTVGLRYMKDWFFWWPVALIKAWKYGGLHELTDDKFSEIFYQTCYAKYLCDEISDKNKEIFKDYLKVEKKYHIIDFSAMDLVVAENGYNTEKTITLVEFDGKNGRPIAIFMRDYVVDASDGDLFLLGKYMCMVGASVHINVAEHPKLHFPMDAINAITKTAVPKNHILFQLLYPHFEITLKLDYQVLNSPMSLLENKWWMIYSPFGATSESLRDLTVIGYNGIKGNPSYHKYEYPLNGPRVVPGDFGVFHQSYYPVFVEFARKVLAEIPVGDYFVTIWANYIHQQMPSFPDGEKIWQDDNLAKAVGVLLWDLTIGHAVDHRTYSEIPVCYNPMCLKTKAPEYKTPGFKLNLKKAVSTYDQMRWILASRLFYETWNVANMMEIDYGFSLPILNDHVRDFRKQMLEVEKNLKTKNLMPVEEIPTSIQY